MRTPVHHCPHPGQDHLQADRPVPLPRVAAHVAAAEARDQYFVTLPTATARALIDAAAEAALPVTITIPAGGLPHA